MPNKNTDPFGLPNQDKYDASVHDRKRWGRDDETDPQFAPLDKTGYGAGSLDLKRFLGAAAQRVEDAKRPTRLTLHTSTGELPVQIRRNGAKWSAFVPWRGEWREFQSDSYDKLITLLMETFNQGPSIRALTAAEELAAARLCASGHLDDALVLYVRSRCGEVNEKMLDDPNYRKVTDEAAWFVFKHSTNDFVDTKEAREFMNRFVGDRPVTLGLLRSAFVAWREQQKAQPQSVSAEDKSTESEVTQVNEHEVERLSDNQVRETLTAVRREYAEGERRRRDLLRLNNTQQYRTAEQVLQDLHNVPDAE